MRRARIILGLGIGGLLACLPLMPLPAQPPANPDDARRAEVFKRFGAVREWTGTVTVTFNHSVTQDPEQPKVYETFRGSTRWSATASLKLRQTDNPIVWKGDGVAQVGVSSDVYYVFPGTATPKLAHRFSRRGSGQSKLAGPTFQPTLSTNIDGFYLHLGDPTIEVDDHDIRLDTGKTTSKQHKTALWLNVHTLPLPADGVRLQGQREIMADDLDGQGVALHLGPGWLYSPRLWTPQMRPKATVTWDLYPSVEDLELVVEKPAGYADWLPRGDKDEATPAAGNDIKFVARLQKKGGGAPEKKARKIKFELVQTSQEPGVCMNWPPPDQLAAQPMFDLKFDPQRNPGLRPLGAVYGQIVETPEGEHTEATAVISSYDWGAWGTLRVTAEMPGGLPPVIGYLQGDPEQVHIPLPKRQPNSMVADWWKDFYRIPGRSDYDDGENEPVGDGHKGDGLSLYQEYRGFHENGRHITGHPTIKDFFIRDEIGGPGTKAGIATFVTATGLQVHHELLPQELGDDRVINRNSSHAHLVNQHGVRLTRGDPGFRGGLAEDGPGTPRKIKKIIIHPGTITGRLTSQSSRQDYATLVAHELLHSVNVWHHGDTDIGMVRWWVAEQGGRREIIETRIGDDGQPVGGTGKRIRVFDGNQELLPDDPRFRNPWNLWVAVKRGQHSGDPICLMRYDIASAVEGTATDSPTRYLVREQFRSETHLCTNQNGAPHFGNATKGNCTGQVRVNDR